MSSSDHGPAAAHAHDHGDHHDFDPEPVGQLSADEAPSPGWLPLAGGVAFLLAAMWFFYPAGGAGPAAPGAPTTTAAAPAAAAKPADAATTARAARPATDGSARARPRLDLKALPGRRAAPAAATATP